jgi:ribulose-5-phosphate 4-epimerase/fuculose-1-phosphate aldolase
LESIAQIAFGTQMLSLERNCLYNGDLDFRETLQLEEYVLRKHYDRKHGQNAYYGQK